VNRGQRRISIFPILTVNFVGTLGLSIVMPSLVFLVTRFGGNAFVFGLMGATYSFFQLLGAPLLGRWSDRYGRRRILLLSELGTFASWVIFLTAVLLPSLPLTKIDSPYCGTALLAVGNGIMWPSLLAILLRTTERSVQGTVQGFASSAGAIASIGGCSSGHALRLAGQSHVPRFRDIGRVDLRPVLFSAREG
jgi:MFS family permease